jgi:DNA invertase Pin-like site-specific DNA recombinase
MSRTFPYARVSTVEQEPTNQLQEIEAAGFGIEPHRIVTETVSGSMAMPQRDGFSRLIDKMEKDDVLIERTQAGLARVKAQGKLLGRPPALSPDQQQTVRTLIEKGEPISAIAR